MTLLFLLPAFVLCTGGCDPAAPARRTDSSGRSAVESSGSPATEAVKAAAAADPALTVAAPTPGEGSPPAERSQAAPRPSQDGDRTRDTAENPGTRTSDATRIPARRLRLPADGLAPDIEQLAAQGIHAYESTHLLLLSDIPAEQAADLPALADLLFSRLEESLGSLAPAPDGAPFRVIGCLIDARERFTAAGLMPSEQFAIRHGRHLNDRFWMFNPPSDYYRRHLLLHEFVHCFMNCEYGMFDIPPLWYTEGIAEFFATHSLADTDGRTASFGVLPENIDQFHGWGRIAEVRRSFQNEPNAEVTDAGFTSLHNVIDPLSPVYDKDSQYAHAWALYWLLQNHPEYRNAFGSFAAVRSNHDYTTRFASLAPETLKQLAIDWPLILDSLIEAFDGTASFPVRHHFNMRFEQAGDQTDNPDGANAATAIAGSVTTGSVVTGSVVTGSVSAAQGWQSPGWIMRAGQTMEVTATGRFAVAQDPRPWISEPSGITIRYHRGRPLGELVAMLVAEDGSRASRRIPVGRQMKIRIPWDGELWLQLNDSAASRADNSGEAEVTIRISTDERP